MGSAGLVSRSVIEDIKMLSAFSTREGVELESLLEAYIASHHPSAPWVSGPTWRYFWSRLSIAAVFSKNALPQATHLVSELRGTSEVRDLKSGSSSSIVKQVIDHGDVDQHYNLGKQFSRGLMK